MKISKCDSEKKIELDDILNPDLRDFEYGKITKYLGIDCEMDHVKPEWQLGQGSNIPCKVSVVNQDGYVVLDTLIQPHFEGENYPDPTVLTGYKNLEFLHGIKAEWLSNAPTFQSVRDHILFLCGRASQKDDQECEFDPAKHSIFVAHGATVDLKVMGIYDVPYFCTLMIDRGDLHQNKKLKDLCAKYLNA